MAKKIRNSKKADRCRNHPISAKTDPDATPKGKKCNSPKKEDQIEVGDVKFTVKYTKALPPLSKEQKEKLKSDISERGVVVPIIVDEKFNVIDGEHRLQVVHEEGLKEVPFSIRPGLAEEEKWKMAEDLNLHRRHLTQEEIQDILKQNRERLPQKVAELRQKGKSYRVIGDELGISHQQAKNIVDSTTVNDLTVKSPEVIVGKDGKKRPARKTSISVKNLKELQKGVDCCHKAGDKLPSKAVDLKRASKISTQIENEKLRQQEVHDHKEGSIELLQGDFIEKTKEIQDSSVDMIFTDPPYDKESLYLWGELGLLAKRVLKPGGLLISYTGALYLNQVMEYLNNNLDYLWMGCCLHSGHTRIVYPRNINQCWKPIVMYYKPPLNKWWGAIKDVVSEGRSKDNHDWEQPVEEALHFIKAMCPTDGTLLDPMMGSGSTILAGMKAKMGLKCIGMEKDKATFVKTQKRISGHKII